MKSELVNQYYQSLDMVKDCMQAYSQELWYSHEYQNPAWQVFYHVLFYTNIYCSPTEERIQKWEKEEKDCHRLTAFDRSEGKSIQKEYSSIELTEFLEHIKGCIKEYVEEIKPEKDCWPYWYNLNQFEFHLNNLRHLQHHIGELYERLNNRNRISYKWR